MYHCFQFLDLKYNLDLKYLNHHQLLDLKVYRFKTITRRLYW